ncbi:MAG: hypothetical protein Q4E89_07440 [Eubacteriales bacterium]|nr:hypothetical protein [Eubacteriales bacterium]
MKKFNRFLLILSVLFLIIGIGFTVAGLSMGATWEKLQAVQEEGGLESIGRLWIQADRLHTDKEWEEELDELVKSSDAQGIRHISGGGDENIYEVSADEVKALIMDVSCNSLVLDENGKGDAIVITVEEGSGDKVTVAKKDSALLIQDKRKFFYSDGEITISYPENLTLDSMELSMDAGEAELWGSLQADTVQVSIGAGELNGSGRITCTSSKWEVGAGSIYLETVDSRETQLKCGIGELDITLFGRESDYNYELKCGIGDLEVGRNSYGGFGGSKSIDNGADRAVKADCGIGELNIDFEEDES